MSCKFTVRDRFDLLVVGLSLIGIILLAVCVAYAAEPVEVAPEEPAVIFSKPVIVDADPVQLIDPDSTLTETEPVEEDIPEFTGYVDPEPVYTPEPTNPPVTEPQEDPSEPVEAPESDDYESTDELTLAEMLAIVIYQEGGGNATCQECRYRIGDIALNRVSDPRFPNTLYGVLTQEGQYGRLAWTGIVWADRAQYAGEAEAVARARAVANDILSGNHSSLYGNGYVWQAGFVQGTEGFWCCGHYYARG